MPESAAMFFVRGGSLVKADVTPVILVQEILTPRAEDKINPRTQNDCCHLISWHRC